MTRFNKSSRSRTAAEQEREAKKTGAAKPKKSRKRTEAKNSYGPFGRADREPQPGGKTPSN